MAGDLNVTGLFALLLLEIKFILVDSSTLFITKKRLGDFLLISQSSSSI